MINHVFESCGCTTNHGMALTNRFERSFLRLIQRSFSGDGYHYNSGKTNWVASGGCCDTGFKQQQQPGKVVVSESVVFSEVVCNASCPSEVQEVQKVNEAYAKVEELVLRGYGNTLGLSNHPETVVAGASVASINSVLVTAVMMANGYGTPLIFMADGVWSAIAAGSSQQSFSSYLAGLNNTLCDSGCPKSTVMLRSDLPPGQIIVSHTGLMYHLQEWEATPGGWVCVDGEGDNRTPFPMIRSGSIAQQTAVEFKFGGVSSVLGSTLITV